MFQWISTPRGISSNQRITTPPPLLCISAEIPGFSKTHNVGDDKYHQQAIDREFQREMRLAEEALRRREELGVRRWLQLQRQQQKMLERGNIADDPDYSRSLKHKRPFEPGQGRYASNTDLATYPNSTSRPAYCPKIAVKQKTNHSSRGERKELDEDFRKAS